MGFSKTLANREQRIGILLLKKKSEKKPLSPLSLLSFKASQNVIIYHNSLIKEHATKTTIKLLRGSQARFCTAQNG